MSSHEIVFPQNETLEQSRMVLQAFSGLTPETLWNLVGIPVEELTMSVTRTYPNELELRYQNNDQVKLDLKVHLDSGQAENLERSWIRLMFIHEGRGFRLFYHPFVGGAPDDFALKYIQVAPIAGERAYNTQVGFGRRTTVQSYDSVVNIPGYSQIIDLPIQPDLYQDYPNSPNGPKYFASISSGGCLLTSQEDCYCYGKLINIKLLHHIGLSADTLRPVLAKVAQLKA